MSGIPQSVFVFGECSCFINLWCSGYFTAAFNTVKAARPMSVSVFGKVMFFNFVQPKNPLAAMPFTAYFFTVSPSLYSTLSGIVMLSSALLLALTTALSPSMVYCKPPATNVCANILGAIRERPIAAIRNFYCFMLVECWCKDKK